ncbi:SDR family oxidoreductase [Kineococcus sp. SYSU DK003]|uniref:SDR family oxidoreductase n=1 Tax=Kineococcus sp. SYSU DK003 TaxID=3383124 RepID=UPI003D7D9E06
MEHVATGEGRVALVTGVTGYIGGRLVPELLAAGFTVRAMARRPELLRDRPWIDDVEVVQADASDADQVAAALEGVDVAYYLIHAMSAGGHFSSTDRRTARTFARAAAARRVGRIVYLGGLHPEDEELSTHLESRREVGEILLDGPVPATVLQAAVIIGSGSASFEMMRYLTERLPVMVCPSWVSNRIQPIAVRDVLRYLVGSASMPAQVNRTFDIGGPDVLTYLDMMRGYARVAGLPKRTVLPVKVMSPKLSSHWVGLITPVPKQIARPLVESLVHEVVCKEHDIARYVPDPPGGLIPFSRAVRLALQRVQEANVATRWSSASVPGAPSDPLPSDPGWAGGNLYEDDRTTVVDAPPRVLWQVLEGIGGEQGWYSWPMAWAVRGVMDRFSGGPGLRRGRRDPRHLMIGDAVDWWRVEERQQDRLLRLRAEMRVPGLAWLDLSIETDPVGRTLFRQRARFHPKGLAGQAYWAGISPFHGVVFGGMQRNVKRAAEAAARGERPASPVPAPTPRGVDVADRATLVR